MIWCDIEYNDDMVCQKNNGKLIWYVDKEIWYVDTEYYDDMACQYNNCIFNY